MTRHNRCCLQVSTWKTVKLDGLRFWAGHNHTWQLHFIQGINMIFTYSNSAFSNKTSKSLKQINAWDAEIRSMIFLSLRIWQTWWQSCHRFPWIAPSITCQTSLQASGSFCPIWDMRVKSFFQRYDLALIGNMIIYLDVSHRHENLQYRFLLTWTLPRGFGEFPQLGFNFERPHITYPISIHFPNIHGPLRVLLVARQPLQLNLWGGIRHNAVGSSQLGVRFAGVKHYHQTCGFTVARHFEVHPLSCSAVFASVVRIMPCRGLHTCYDFLMHILARSRSNGYNLRCNGHGFSGGHHHQNPKKYLAKGAS